MNRKRKGPITGFAAAALLAVILWIAWGNSALMVHEIAITDSKIPEPFSGFRIVQVSDLHNAEFGADNQRLLTMLESTNPDIIVLTGDLVDSSHTDIEVSLAFARQAVRIAPTYYTVLLSHRPELFDTYVEGGVDLVLTGHAHGGQFRLPVIGGVVAPGQGLFPKYDAGLYTEGSANMVVSRGLGNSVIPFRVNNRPEIVVLELKQ